MKIIPYGAAGGEVTGSAYYIETAKARLLLDCGLFQGSQNAESKNHAPGGQLAAKLDAVVLTHGHLDHTGRLPLLTKNGFKGPIYTTPATIEMTGLILRDTAKIQVQDAERHNRKQQRAGEEVAEPLYTPEDVEALLQLLKPVPYKQPVPVAPGIQAVWSEAGHMLGSASIQLLVEDEGRTKKVVFSGDLGPKGAPILKDYEPFREADFVFLESTYGDRDHQPFADTVKQFVKIVQDAVASGGKILVPTFAVGRAQTLTLLLSWMFRTHKINPFPLFLDSPMATQASAIYAHHKELYDQEMLQYLREGSMAEDLRTLKTTASADESKAINLQPGPFLVMAGAGMCNAGRILHHLRNNLWRPETHVMIVGYQGEGSLGRMLVQGEKTVKIFGEKIAVKAQIHTLGGFSAHAGQTDLLGWFDAVAPAKPRVALTHGEDPQRRALAKKIQERYQIKAILPGLEEEISI